MLILCYCHRCEPGAIVIAIGWGFNKTNNIFFVSALALPSPLEPGVLWAASAMRRPNLCFSIALKLTLSTCLALRWLEVTRFEGRLKIALLAAGARIAFELVASELECIIRNGFDSGCVVWAVCCFRWKWTISIEIATRWLVRSGRRKERVRAGKRERSPSIDWFGQIS